MRIKRQNKKLRQRQLIRARRNAGKKGDVALMQAWQRIYERNQQEKNQPERDKK